MPIILATQEAEIRRILIGSQPRQIVHETLSQKYPSQKRTGGVAQVVGPEFKPQYLKKKKRCTLKISGEPLHLVVLGCGRTVEGKLMDWINHVYEKPA
jgi:hypothetical protein